MVDLLEVEVEPTSREEGVELQGRGEVEAAMGIGQVDGAWSGKRFLRHRFWSDRSYCE